MKTSAMLMTLLTSVPDGDADGPAATIDEIEMGLFAAYGVMIEACDAFERAVREAPDGLPAIIPSSAERNRHLSVRFLWDAETESVREEDQPVDDNPETRVAGALCAARQAALAVFERRFTALERALGIELLNAGSIARRGWRGPFALIRRRVNGRDYFLDAEADKGGGVHIGIAGTSYQRDAASLPLKSCVFCLALEGVHGTCHRDSCPEYLADVQASFESK